jgi:hypothetical protein
LFKIGVKSEREIEANWRIKLGRFSVGTPSEILSERTPQLWRRLLSENPGALLGLFSEAFPERPRNSYKDFWRNL